MTKGNAGGNRCLRCAAAFVCGMQAGRTSGWCAALPVLEEASEAATECFCPACLHQLLEEQRQRDAAAA